MRKKTKLTQEYTPKMTIIYIETTREKKQNNSIIPLDKSDCLWYNAFTIEKQTRVPRTPVAFRREGFKPVKRNMQTTNNNTLTQKGIIKLSFTDLCFASVFGVLSAWMWVAIVTL